MMEGQLTVACLKFCDGELVAAVPRALFECWRPEACLLFERWRLTSESWWKGIRRQQRQKLRLRLQLLRLAAPGRKCRKCRLSPSLGFALESDLNFFFGLRWKAKCNKAPAVTQEMRYVGAPETS